MKPFGGGVEAILLAAADPEETQPLVRHLDIRQWAGFQVEVANSATEDAD